MSDVQPVTAKGRRTKAALVQAAREVFEEKGYLDTRVSDIAAAAGVAHGSFYGYFDSKEAVFRDVITQVVGEVFDASRSGVHGADPVAAIDAANRRFVDAWQRNRKILLILDQVATFHEEFRSLWFDVRRLFVDRSERGIKTLQAEGLADPDLDPRIAAAALGGMVENFARAWLLYGEPYDAEAAMSTITRLWAKAIGLQV